MSLGKQLTINELRKYPTDTHLLKTPDARIDSRASVAKGRDGPFDIHYKIYGQGPNKIVWICGHGGGLWDWSEMIQYFGVDNVENYTILVFENRGIGESGAPWSIWSTKGLAEDVKDLLDHVGWREDRSVNVVGHSMGGMAAMELAIAHPNRLASLTLISTTTHWARDAGVLTIIKQMLPTIINTQDGRLTRIKLQIFSPGWLSAPPPPSTDPAVGAFPTNGDTFAYRVINSPTVERGGILQMPAGARHRVDPNDLRRVAEALGPGNVGIVHGGLDRMLPMSSAEHSFREMGGGTTGVKILLLDGVGHVPMKEKPGEVAKFIVGMIGGNR